jgi:hypothetical protein
VRDEKSLKDVVMRDVAVIKPIERMGSVTKVGRVQIMKSLEGLTGMQRLKQTPKQAL